MLRAPALGNPYSCIASRVPNRYCLLLVSLLLAAVLRVPPHIRFEPLAVFNARRLSSLDDRTHALGDAPQLRLRDDKGRHRVEHPPEWTQPHPTLDKHRLHRGHVAVRTRRARGAGSG